MSPSWNVTEGTVVLVTVVLVVVVVSRVVEVVDEVLVDVVVEEEVVVVVGGEVVVVVVGGTLHLPALLALKMDWISPAVRARLKSSNSSMTPLKFAKAVLFAIAPI